MPVPAQAIHSKNPPAVYSVFIRILFYSTRQLLSPSQHRCRTCVSFISTDSHRKIFPLRTFCSQARRLETLAAAPALTSTRGDNWKPGFDSSPLDARPCVQDLYIGVRQLGIAMNQRVLKQWHLAVLNRGCDIRQELFSLLEVVLVPLREIHVITPPAYISFHQPGHRCHIAVPRPHGLVRVAVHACTFQHGSSFC